MNDLRKVKRKTAIIAHSLIAGASSGAFFTVKYRAKTRFHLSGHCNASVDLFDSCKKWAFENGFTHIKQVVA